MAISNPKQEPSNEKIKMSATKADNKNNPDQQQTPILPDTDMEPDEFLAPNADTDLPIEHHVANDAVLRGEDHADEKIDNLPSNDKKNKDD